MSWLRLVLNFATESNVVNCIRSRFFPDFAIIQVLNAASLYWPMPNILYVEGYALDRFAEGLWALQPVHQNKVRFMADGSYRTYQ